MPEDLKEHLYILVMSGGGGTRLWPVSRKKTPKQFLNFFGDKTIFAQAVDTLREITSNDKIFAITNTDYVDEVIQQGNLSLKNVIPEPKKRNTALAMAVGAAIIAKADPQAVVVNFPGDNIVFPIEKFKEDIFALAEIATKKNCLSFIGTKPSFPHTGFGYVRVAEATEDFQGKKVFKVLEFKEKPDLSTAEEFVADGHYFWNASFYTWKASALLKACQKHAPKIYEGALRVQQAWGTKDEQEVLKQVYDQAEDLSIDYAVSEKADNLYLILSTFTWNDLGNWKEIWELSEKDELQNAVLGQAEKGHTEIESKGNLIWANDRFVSLVGVNDLFVVDTPDALLICHKDKVQDVKKVVEFLKEKERKELL